MAKSVAYTSLSTGNLRPAGCFAPSFSAVSSWWGSLGSGAKVGVLLFAASAVVGTGLGVGLRNRNRPAAAAAADFCGYSGYRLPANAAPLLYNITLTLPVSGGVFVPPYTIFGRVSIDVALSMASPCVLLHAGANLAVSSVSANSAAAAWSVDAVNDRLVVRLPAGAGAAGSIVRIDVAFAFNASSNNLGLYLSSYVDDSGAKITALATQFEACYARTAFPCFDEPALKANFSLTVDGVPPGFTALGNMPQAAAAPRADGAQTITFATTPRMSTYLVAFVASPLVRTTIANVGSGRIPVTTYAVARGANADRIAYAAKAAAAIIPFFESKFGLPFPLPKMDMVALPDFSAGAMENWGLITYRETAMLGNVSTSSQAELQRVAVVVAHELAHQWNGDIVTMDWWSALWLNEGFASRMEFLGAEAWEPGFGIEQQFQSSDTLRALRADAFSAVQQLTQSVDSTAAIEGMFSAISYAKGASLLKCLQTWLAAQGKPDAFFAGVSAYLHANAYGAAAPLSLWTSLAAAAATPALVGWAQTFELQPGFPLVTVAWAAGSPVAGKGKLELSQRRFFLSPASAARAGAAEAARLYWVPLTIGGGAPAAPQSAIPAAVAASRDAAQAFTGLQWPATIGTDETPFDLNVDGFVKIGINSTIYARVNYPAEIWAALAAEAARSAAGAASALTAGDRGALLDDFFTLALSGAFVGEGINATAALRFAASFLGAETAYEPMVVFLSAATTLAALAVPDAPIGGNSAGNPDYNPFDAKPGAAACSSALSSYVLTQLAAAQAALTWNASPGEPPITTQLRASVLGAASAFGDAGVIARAAALYAGGAGVATLPPDLASVVLASVSRWGPESVAQAMFTAYLGAVAAGDSTAARRFLSASTASRSRSWLNTALGYVLDAQVPVGDKVSLLTGVASNALGRDLAWAWLTSTSIDGEYQNWRGLTALFPPGGFDMSAIVASLAGPFQTSAFADSVSQFWGPGSGRQQDIAGALNDLVAAQEIVARNVAFENAQYDATCAWLRANYAPP